MMGQDEAKYAGEDESSQPMDMTEREKISKLLTIYRHAIIEGKMQREGLEYELEEQKSKFRILQRDQQNLMTKNRELESFREMYLKTKNDLEKIKKEYDILAAAGEENSMLKQGTPWEWECKLPPRATDSPPEPGTARRRGKAASSPREPTPPPPIVCPREREIALRQMLALANERINLLECSAAVRRAARKRGNGR